MWSHQCVIDVTTNLSPVFFFFLLYFRSTSMFISSFLSNSRRHFLFVVWRTGAWHWWCCKQLKIRRWVGLGGGPYGWCQLAVWCDTMTILVFKDGRHQSCFSHRTGSRQAATVQNLNEWMSLFCCLFYVLNLYLPVSLTGECLYGGGPWLGSSVCLCDIAVLVCRGLASLNVLLVDEHLDALLDHADTGVEPGFGLIDDLHTERSEIQNSYSEIANRDTSVATHSCCC